jgi:3-oxoacyl-[acyl-carrier-protein] synthase I
MHQNRVFVNNYDALCCAGTTATELFDNICSHQSGISILDNYVENKSVAIGKIKKDFEIADVLKEYCERILTVSNLDDFSDTLLVVGSSVGGMRTTEEIFFKTGSYESIDPKLHNIHTIAYILNQEFTFKDDISFSTACTSSANAIGYAYEAIKKGVVSNALVIGFDTLSYTTICGFDALSVLSSRPCKPFDKDRDGMNVSEGLGILLLQNQKTDNSVEVCGVGYSSDAHHMTQPSPDGDGAMIAMKQALGLADIDAQKINYINAHGTGTMANDLSEANAIIRLFGDNVNVSSTKSITGHTLGAAGAIEAIVSVMAIQKQILPPNTSLQNPENENINLVRNAIPYKIEYTLSNSLAFGGNNTSIVFGIVK